MAKHEFLSKTCFKECNTVMIAKNLWVTMNLYKKSLPIITWNKKCSLK